ncbi:potassium channel family protein [Brachybacterium hainanense]|uniref:Potassium channel family protein n=1 Tax=Brachybacterium hainanense TaxID=1541174 RepID=A0ABV6RH82_9MICO
MARKNSSRSAAAEPGGIRTVAVLGLGRFGSSLGRELESQGIEVLGIDTDEEIVQELGEELSFAARADISRADALAQLGVADMDRVVVSVGSRIETSVLACSHLLRAGVRSLWAKADSSAHEQILAQMGVEHVISPQAAMGRRVAHLLAESAEDWTDYGGGFVMGRFAVPTSLVHRMAADAGIEQEFSVRIIARRPFGGAWEYPSPQTVYAPGDELIVAGPYLDLERFGRDA